MVGLQQGCIVILLFIAIIYYSVKRKRGYAHTIFIFSLSVTTINIIFDMLTVYTVNHLDTIDPTINWILHLFFIGTMLTEVSVVHLYIAALLYEDEETLKKRFLIGGIPYLIGMIGMISLPLYYVETPQGNYAYGPSVFTAYITICVYLLVSISHLFAIWRQINERKRDLILLALGIESIILVIQMLFPVLLISSLGLVLLNLAIFLTVESPDVHLIESLKEEKLRADEANKAKSQFLANMSHEIRTPINTIVGMNEMILRKSTEEQIKNFATDIAEAARSLLDIINDILDFSKIESGKMQLIMVHYKLDQLLNEAMNMVSGRAKEKGIKLTLEAASSLPNGLYGDDVRIRQILLNLLTNAIKYTHEGEVKIQVDGEVQGNEVTLHYKVIDTGIGIKEKDIEKLFKAFERIEVSRNRHIEGTGLGINIVTNLLDLMGSKLSVKSEYGKGSVFAFSLRQKILDHTCVGDIEAWKRIRMPQQPYHQLFAAPRAKVLIVDDQEMNRKVFVHLLQQTKMQITEASSGKEALKLVEKTRFDLIFLDHMMPQMDGIETLKRMKCLELTWLNKVPIIMLTANAIAGAKAQYLMEGFDDYLSKPIVFKELEQMIYRYLPKELIEKQVGKPIEGETEKEEVASQMVFPEIDGVDFRYASLYIEKPEMLMKLMREFVGQLMEKKTCLEKWYETIGEEESRNAYRIEVHALKSTSAMLGILTVFSLAKLQEKAVLENEIETISLLHPLLMKELIVFNERLSCLLPKVERKKEIGDISQLLSNMSVIQEGLKEKDYDSVEKAMEALASYTYEEAVEKMMKALESYIIGFETEKALQISQQLISYILERMMGDA